MNRRTYLCHYIIYIIIISLLLPNPIYPQTLSSKTLQGDILYYKRVSKEQNLNKNDRYYILLRIKEKYKNSNIDLSPLLAEIDNLENDNNRLEISSFGTVKNISLKETEQDSRIVITATGVSSSNYFIIRDPENKNPPKIVLDLYGVVTTLPQNLSSIKSTSGMFSYIETSQFENDPKKIVRIIAQMREDVPYKIKKLNEDTWIIIANKKNKPLENTNSDYISIPVSTTTTIPTQKIVQKTKDTNNETSYKIESGDIIAINIYPAEELSRELIVQPEGIISLPLVGTVKAKGLTQRQLEEILIKEFKRFISNPQITVNIRQFSRRQLFIMGEVRQAGAYNYKENIRLLEFISSAGGFTDTADRRDIKIYRGPASQRKVYRINVEDIIRSGDFSKDFILEPGDIIEVGKGQARVAILGDVRNPGYYDFKENMRLLELISLAGGFTETAQIKKITVIDKEIDNEIKVNKVNLAKILEGLQPDITLKSGDTIYIPKKKLASAGWFINTILPWVSLISLILVIRTSI